MASWAEVNEMDEAAAGVTQCTVLEYCLYLKYLFYCLPIQLGPQNHGPFAPKCWDYSVYHHIWLNSRRLHSKLMITIVSRPMTELFIVVPALWTVLLWNQPHRGFARAFTQTGEYWSPTMHLEKLQCYWRNFPDAPLCHRTTAITIQSTAA